MYSIFLNNNSDAIYTTVSIVLFPNRVLRYEANYICTIILQRLRTESRFSGGGGGASQSAISLRNQCWLIGLLMIFGSFTSSVNNCHRPPVSTSKDIPR